MTVLAFDCCLRRVSVTVLRDGRAFTHDEAAEQGGQAERLMPMIEAARADAGLAWADIARIAVTCGPGGFTSVRVGIAAARALALALRIPAVGETTLAALAATALAGTDSGRDPAPAGRIVAVIEAGKGGIYQQAFDRSGAAATPARLIEANDLATAAAPGDTLIGPGCHVVATAMGSAAHELCGIHHDFAPLSQSLAQRAHLLTVGTELRPIYLRDADAKPQMGKRLTRA
jgi:tRNA threonylcarbamoyladenosine biosynthesis protein TsaB